MNKHKQKIPRVKLPSMNFKGEKKEEKEEEKEEEKDCGICEYWQDECFIRDVNGVCIKFKKKIKEV